MNPDTHKPSELYCPYCLKQLVEVNKTGHLFCPSSVWCEYEAGPLVPSIKAPLSENQMLESKVEAAKDRKQAAQEELNKARKQLNAAKRSLIK